ncbi:MAG: ThiF family adenylyltransferase [Tenericutes bacterium]|nr:ThiF family adenylyltransferase [Mycoplasmatota bacterium]
MEKYVRLEKVIGKDKVDDLGQKCVLVIGCGGVGGYVCEALARSNIGRLIIVDFDVVDVTNINRQIIALESTIGQKKVDVLEKRLKDINSNLDVVKIDSFIGVDNIEVLFKDKLDYLVDACDSIKTKLALIDECLKRKIPFVSSMGTGNKLDPTKLDVVDIRKTVNDPLARIIRKYVKDKKIKDKVMVLSSTEVPVKTGERTPGSTAFVPGTAGLILASFVVRNLIKEKE